MIRNQFLGINPLLHAEIGETEGWKGFHTAQIVFILRAMRQTLVPQGIYTANMVQSLQVSEDDDGEHPYWAVVIHRIYETGGNLKPIARIELLSESNKPGGRFWQTYQDNRNRFLAGDVVYVELDYLHESPPTFDYIPDYTRWQTQPNSRAYRIMVVDARLTLWDGTAYIHQFDVDTSIPTVTIPLSGADQFDFDFNAPYQKTYEEMLYGQIQVKYDELPVNFERYSRADQARILTRLLWVRDGQGAERVPAPLPPLSYEEAHQRWG